ncbi:MAG TPA: F0F1 ATP synthase subunit epsilon [Candidatus Eisenbacteria bacterium]|jgi:F-type H+-transporting ATPase subunit epsilon|nr:F0F1 ATP synthase subunit epsilon [Candidatus Eisenbacteria bacterium]
MSDAIQLVIVTPERQILKESVSQVTMPGADGYLGVLPGHAPLITELGVGELTYRTSGGQNGLLAVIRGFAEVLPDRVSVLAETAEFAEDIDLARAQGALKRAQERIARGGENMDWDRATLSLQRALVRISVVSKHQGINIASAR